MRFDFHKYKSFNDCPKKYHLETTSERPTPRNCYFSVPGEFVQKFFEMYANHWKALSADVSEIRVRERMRPHWETLLKYNPIDWKDPMCRLSKEDLYNDCISIIMANLQDFDLYDETKSEVKIEVLFKSGDVLVSKIDFIKQLDSEYSAIYDGKMSGTIGKYVDSRQLLFYAIMHRLKYGKLPKELAFLYYKHRVLDRINFTEADVDQLWTDIIKTMALIKETKEFKPTPKAKACKFCDFLSVCEEGKKDMDSRKRPKKLVNLRPTSKKDSDGLYSL
jgi:CRISPR/Cas system-associated exonuclease Cas4 (RecB family)